MKKQRASGVEKPTSLDWALAASVALAGGALVFSSVRRDPNALSFAAPMDGAITAVVVGSLLALVHGLRFRAVAALLAPIVLVQIQAIRAAGFRFRPPWGSSSMIAGFLGLVASSRGRELRSAIARSSKGHAAAPALSRSRELLHRARSSVSG